MKNRRSRPADELLGLVLDNRVALLAVLEKYSASNPRVFGSVAQGVATSASDIDILVDLAPAQGNALLRVAGISEELSCLLGVRVDVVADELLRQPVADSAHSIAIAI